MDVKRESSLAELQAEIQYSFADAALLERCMTHISYERSQRDGHNEVLEFLGDAVLDLAVSELLIRQYPERNEGDLSRMRAGLVVPIIGLMRAGWRRSQAIAMISRATPRWRATESMVSRR